MEKYLTCKKELLGNKIIFRPGKKYKIESSDENCIFIVTDEFDENTFDLSPGMWFSIKTASFRPTIKEYFYANNELRKNKIKQLNGKIFDL
jgi:hypothetical protein